MIDVHSHLLQGVDDGSVDISESIKLLKTVYEQGVTDLVLTPHYRLFYKQDKEAILREFELLKTQAKDSGIDVNLYLGQEVYVEKNYKSLVQDEKIFLMNGSKYLLVEFDFEYKADILNIVYELVRMGYKPIVAHVERYWYIDVYTTHMIRQTGGLIQVNAESIVGKSSLRQKKLVKKLFKEGLVDFVAGDMHSGRKYLMKKAYEKVKRKYGTLVANAVFKENAQEIIKGQSE